MRLLTSLGGFKRGGEFGPFLSPKVEFRQLFQIVYDLTGVELARTVGAVGENIWYFLCGAILPCHDDLEPDLESDRIERDAFDHRASAKEKTRGDVADRRERARERDRDARGYPASQRPIDDGAALHVAAADRQLACAALDRFDHLRHDVGIVTEIRIHDADDRRHAGRPAVDDG